MSDVEQLAPRNSSASRRRITRFIVCFLLPTGVPAGQNLVFWLSRVPQDAFDIWFAEIFDFPLGWNLSGGDRVPFLARFFLFPVTC
jgi:hypothetical protein